MIGLRLETVADGFEAAVAKLRAVSKDGHGGFRVYTKADAPNHWHISFENDVRILANRLEEIATGADG